MKISKHVIENILESSKEKENSIAHTNKIYDKSSELKKTIETNIIKWETSSACVQILKKQIIINH